MKSHHILLAAALAAMAISNAQAHARLEASDPKPASEMDKPPAQIKLKFNEALEPAFSKLRVLDAANADVKLAGLALDKSDPKTMVATLPSLHSGKYRVQWSTVTHDGHTTRGEFSFRVR